MRAPRRRWRTVVAAAGLLAVATTACGIPVDRGPIALSKAGVPFDLLAPSPPATTSTSGPAPVAVQVFLLAPSGGLAAVTRDVPYPAPLTAILGALVDGPTDAEAGSGLQSAIPAQTVVLSAAVTGGVATVDLAGTFAQLVGQAQIDAAAQIVFTATALPGVTGVSFELSDQPVDVPTANGVDVPTANRSQFASLAP